MTRFGAGWRQVAACLMLLAACAMIAATYSLVAVPIGREFHPSRMVLMLSMTVLSAVTGLLSPFLGNLMDRVSLRLLMMLGVASLAAGFVALSFATEFVHVLVIYGLFMAPANVLIGPMATAVLISRWFVKRRGTALGIAISGIAVGTFVFPIVIQALLDHFAWREAFRLLALILFVSMMPAATMVVNRPADKGLHPDGADADPAVQASHATGRFLPVRTLLTDPTFWLVAAVIAVVTSGMKGMVTNLAPLALDEGIAADKAAFLISIYAACGFVAKLGFAAVADRLNPRVLLTASLLGFGAGMACLIRADAGYTMIVGGVGLVGFFGGLMVPMQGLLVPRIFGQNVVGRVSGVLNLVILCALLSTPPIFGRIFDMTGDYDAIFIIFAGLAVVTILAVPYIRLHPKGAEIDAPEPPAELAPGVR